MAEDITTKNTDLDAFAEKYGYPKAAAIGIFNILTSPKVEEAGRILHLLQKIRRTKKNSALLKKEKKASERSVKWERAAIQTEIIFATCEKYGITIGPVSPKVVPPKPVYRLSKDGFQSLEIHAAGQYYHIRSAKQWGRTDDFQQLILEHFKIQP